MRTHIDWLTFTITPRYRGEGNEAYAAAINDGIVDMFGSILGSRLFGGAWEVQEKSRAPYTDAWRMDNGGITLYASPLLTHACFEISGQGCERLIASGEMEALMVRAADRVTRIDIACDIETDVKPEDFVAITKHDRMRASGYQKRETGETSYVGSQKSDRYARV